MAWNWWNLIGFALGEVFYKAKARPGGYAESIQKKGAYNPNIEAKGKTKKQEEIKNLNSS